MQLTQIPIAADDTTVTITVQFTPGDVGAYSLYLWNSQGTQRTLLREGINTDDISDNVDLQPPNSQYRNRIIDCIATVIAPNPAPGSQFAIDLIVTQGGTEKGRITDQGEIGSSSITTRLAALLVNQS